MGIRGILLFAITVTALMRKGMCPLTGRGRPGLQRMLFDAAGRKLAKNQRGGKGAARKLKPEEVDFWLSRVTYTAANVAYPFMGYQGQVKQGMSITITPA